MKKTLVSILLGAALLAPASAQVAGSPRSEPIDVKATDRVTTQSGTGLLPREAAGQSDASFSMPNRNFRVGSPVNSGAHDVKQFPAPPAALTPEHTNIPVQQFPAQAPPALDIKNAGDTTLDSRPSRDIKTQTAPPAASATSAPAESGPITTQTPAARVNADGVSQNPSALQYGTKATPLDPTNTMLPSPTGPRDNSRSTRMTPSPREVRANPATGAPAVRESVNPVRGGELPR